MAVKPFAPNPPKQLDFPDTVIEEEKDQPKNLFHIVANKKITNDNPLLRENLIKLTEKLAEEAKNGTLKGLGGFAEYEGNEYIFGLEGSYLENPESAVLPMKRLDRRIMDQIEAEDE